MHIELELQDRKIEFDLDYDPTFEADVKTRYFLEQRRRGP